MNVKCQLEKASNCSIFGSYPHTLGTTRAVNATHTIKILAASQFLPFQSLYAVCERNIFGIFLEYGPTHYTSSVLKQGRNIKVTNELHQKG